jgi:glycosyltransferase involved in cell wall biosynthesis
MLWVSHSSRIGGAELALAESVDALAERGHEVHVVLPEEGPLRARLRSASSVQLCWHNWWADNYMPELPKRFRRIGHDIFKARERLSEIVDDLGAEVVVSNTLTAWSGALAARKSRRPHVWFLHEFGIEDHGLRFLLGDRASFAFMRSHTDLYLVNSSALRSHYARRLPQNSIHLVRYAVEIPPRPPVEQAADDTFRMAMFGQRKGAKGQQDAVIALEMLATTGLEVQLYLVGRQEEPRFDDHLRHLAGSASDRLYLADHQDDPFELMSRTDVGLMCSRSEAFGRVTVEAMKLGKPVVGASAGATPELIRHGWNGFLYEQGNPADLARWLKQLYSDRDTTLEMGRRAKAWADETFNRAALGDGLEAALGKLGPR